MSLTKTRIIEIVINTQTPNSVVTWLGKVSAEEYVRGK